MLADRNWCGNNRTDDLEWSKNLEWSQIFPDIIGFLETLGYPKIPLDSYSTPIVHICNILYQGLTGLFLIPNVVHPKTTTKETQQSTKRLVER